MKRIAVFTVAAASALFGMSGVASAHQNTAADRFVGPSQDSPAYDAAHTGIQCGAVNSPNLQSLSGVFTCYAEQD